MITLRAVTYRRPDEQRALEGLESRDVEDARTQLASLAQAGRRRQADLGAGRVAAETAEQTRRVPDRFDRRVVRSSRRTAFFAAWAFVATVVAVVSWRVAGWFGLEIAAGVLVSACVPLGMGSHWLFMLPMRRRDATRALAWHDALPFPLRDYVETLSLDHELLHLRVRVMFVSVRPPPDVVEGLLGHIDEPYLSDTAYGSKLVTGDTMIFVVRSWLPDCGFDAGAPNAVGSWVTNVVEQLLLPLHSAYPIAWAELKEGDSGDGQKWKHDQLALLLR